MGNKFFKTISMLMMIFLLSPCLFAMTGRSITSESHQEFDEYVNSVKPMVDAINRYYTDNNKYPSSLSMLMPGYIASLPILRGYEDDMINAICRVIPQNKADKYRYGYEITIVCYKKDYSLKDIFGVGYTNRVLYRPSEEYPERMHEKTLFEERGWAYQKISRGYMDDTTIIEPGFEGSLWQR